MCVSTWASHIQYRTFKWKFYLGYNVFDRFGVDAGNGDMISEVSLHRSSAVNVCL